jgi:hypothetical protein
MVSYLDVYRIANAARGAAQERAEAGRTWVQCGHLAARAAHLGDTHAKHEMNPQLPNDLTSAERDPFLDLVYFVASRV